MRSVLHGVLFSYVSSWSVSVCLKCWPAWRWNFCRCDMKIAADDRSHTHRMVDRKDWSIHSMYLYDLKLYLVRTLKCCPAWRWNFDNCDMKIAADDRSHTQNGGSKRLINSSYVNVSLWSETLLSLKWYLAHAVRNIRQLFYKSCKKIS